MNLSFETLAKYLEPSQFEVLRKTFSNSDKFELMSGNGVFPIIIQASSRNLMAEFSQVESDFTITCPIANVVRLATILLRWYTMRSKIIRFYILTDGYIL